ncbi:hypothetical protein DID88_008143 [Monilinia fructigena]|uniref:Uncharacterized protein n=1 Tax=Monilinia fructigena TaxID=38457 RepID=A0A395J4I5_9HELO|nr:hypothetical protein DID88_008143 [Monilinia fructigena]
MANSRQQTPVGQGEDNQLQLVLATPPSFDVAMTDPQYVAQDSITIDNPPNWAVRTHQHMSEVLQGLGAFSQYVDRNHHENLHEVKTQYESMKQDYETMLQVCRSNMQLTEEQGRQLRQRSEELAYAVTQKIWGTVAIFAAEEQARSQAISKLEEVAQAHQNALHEETQIKDLLAREYLDSTLLDEKFRRQADDLRAYTRDVVAELRDQQDRSQPVDADSIMRTLQERAASQRPTNVRASIENPRSFASRDSAPIPTRRRVSMTHSSSEARMRQNLSNEDLMRSQARRTANTARNNFTAAQAGPITGNDGGNGGGLPPRRFAATGGQDPDDGNSSDNDDHRPSGRPSRTPFTPGPDPSRHQDNAEDRLLRALERLIRPDPAAVVVNPVHLNKPPTYDGRDLSKFQPWWMKVESYLETYQESFPHDLHRINWVGSLLTDKAQLWHQQRTSQVKKVRIHGSLGELRSVPQRPIQGQRRGSSQR